MMDLELWKYIDNYEERYAVSTHGRVKSFYNNRGNKREVPLIMKSQENPEGRLSIGFQGGKRFRIHTLVGKAFIPNPENKPTLDHVDRNPKNNHVSNLRYATYSEQQRNVNCRSNTGVLGVSWSEKSQNYRSAIRLPKKEGEKRGKLIRKYFPVKKYGTKEKALELAIEWRREKEKEICAEFY